MKRFTVIVSASIFLGMSIVLSGCTDTQGVGIKSTAGSYDGSVDESKDNSMIQQNKEPQTSENNKNDMNSTRVMVSPAADFDFSKYSDIQEMTLTDEISAEFVLTTNCNLTDFKIQSIAYDGVNCIIEDILYERDILKPETALKISVYIPPTFSNLLVSYIDKDGKNINCFVNSDLDEGKGAVLMDADQAMNK